ncbi:hypothetical protein BC937DRAFT_88185 [Endogone sp. FLAS-F59071]|nr:hypothetical protein BC937DRAFT_88185 [Endogone sp. FLAS-F59071]|eukprot:RUS22638.1 hypothetical protein BC937DRAFT_88185 [Endogone sp. FLAS-F59071]
MSTPSSNLDELLDTMSDPPLETRRQDEAGLPIFDGENSPQNISVYGFLLGAVFGGSALFVAFNRDVPQIGLFLAALALFHVLEYVATALFNPHKLTLDSYLINHSDSYHAAHAITLLEFALEFYFFPQWKAFGIINLIGLILIIAGQYVRTAAMFRAKSNFSHHVADRKEQGHQLITTVSCATLPILASTGGLWAPRLCYSTLYALSVSSTFSTSSSRTGSGMRSTNSRNSLELSIPNTGRGQGRGYRLLTKRAIIPLRTASTLVLENMDHDNSLH